MIYNFTPPLIQLTIRLQHSWAAKNFYKTPDTDSTSLVSVHVCVWSQDQVDPGHKSLQSSNTILGSILLSSASTSFCTWDHTVSHDQWSQGAPVWDQHHWCQCSIWAARTPSSSSVYMSTGTTTCPPPLLSHTHSSGPRLYLLNLAFVTILSQLHHLLIAWPSFEAVVDHQHCLQSVSSVVTTPTTSDDFCTNIISSWWWEIFLKMRHEDESQTWEVSIICQLKLLVKILSRIQDTNISTVKYCADIQLHLISLLTFYKHEYEYWSRDPRMTSYSQSKCSH